MFGAEGSTRGTSGNGLPDVGASGEKRFSDPKLLLREIFTDKPGHLPRKMTNLNGWVVSSQDHTREKKELLRAHEEAVSNSEH